MLHRIYLTKARNLGFYRGFNGYRPLFSRQRYLLLSDSEVEPCLKQLALLGYDCTAIAEKRPPGADFEKALGEVPPDK